MKGLFEVFMAIPLAIITIPLVLFIILVKSISGMMKFRFSVTDQTKYPVPALVEK